MDQHLHLCRLDVEDPAQLQRYCALWSAAWPEDPIVVAELRFEIDIEPRAQRWIVEPDAGVGNAPMRHINERLGYRRLAARIEWRGSIEALGR